MTVKEDRKRARERAHFEAFRAAYSDFPLGIVESAQQPDFTVVTEAGERLGIEHTEYLVMDAEAGDSYLKMRESLQEKVTSRARQAYEARGLPPVEVRLYWLWHQEIAPSRVDCLAEALAAAVAAYVSAEGSITLESTGLADSPIPDELAALMVGRGDWIRQNCWASSRAGYVLTIAPSEIQRILDRKETRVAEYKKTCSRVWLSPNVETRPGGNA